MKKKPLLLSLLLLMPALASAQLYKWVDEQGQVHYSQTPPRTGKVETVRPALPPAAAGGGTAAIDELNASNDKAAAEAAKQQALDAENKQKKTVNCSLAQDSMARLEEHPANRLRMKQADGSTARMTTEQHEEQVKAARDAAAQWCR